MTRCVSVWLTACLVLAAARAFPDGDAATLEIVSEPAGAVVVLDGEEVGRAPIEIENVTPGDHRVALHLEGYLPNSRDVLLVPGKRSRLVVDLTQHAGADTTAVVAERRGAQKNGTKRWALIGAGVAAAGAGTYLLARGANEAPSIGSVSVSPSSTGIAVVTPFSFSATGVTDPDGDRLEYTWDFGDGLSGASPQTQHVYSVPGTFTPTLTVSDGKESVSQAVSPVTVDVVTGTWSGRTPDGDAAALRLTQSGRDLAGSVTFGWNGGWCRAERERILYALLSAPRSLEIAISAPTYCGDEFWGNYPIAFECELDDGLRSCRGTMTYYSYTTSITLTRR